MSNGTLLHPTWMGLWLCLPALLVGGALGCARASLDRIFLIPTRIAPRLGYHVAFTAYISTTAMLLFYVAIIGLATHGSNLRSFWPWTWCAVIAYGSAVGYGWTMRLYRRLYLRSAAKRAYVEDGG